MRLLAVWLSVSELSIFLSGRFYLNGIQAKNLFFGAPVTWIGHQTSQDVLIMGHSYVIAGDRQNSPCLSSTL